MIDFDERFWRILANHGVKKQNLVKARQLKEQLLIEKLRSLGAETIAIRGCNLKGGEYFTSLLAENGFKVDAIYDRDISPEKANGYVFKTPDSLSESNADLVLVTATAACFEILEELECDVPDKKVLSLFLFFRDEMQFTYDRLLYGIDKDELDYSYYELSKQLIEYRNNASAELEKDISILYLVRKDFVNYKRFAEKYLEKCDDTDFRGLLEDIIELEAFIKKEFENKQNNKGSIIWHFIDNVPYSELKNMPLIRDKMKTGLFFENANTMTPNTGPTFRTIFDKQNKGRYSASTYDNNTDTKLKRLLKSNDYELYYNGNHKEPRGTISAEDCADFNTMEICASQLYWNAIIKLINSNKICMICHTMFETHNPYASPYMDDYENNAFEFPQNYDLLSSRIIKAQQYVDEQINYYIELIGTDYTHIVMSDHGKLCDKHAGRFMDYATHTLLGVFGNNVEKKTESRVFSYYYFCDLIKWIIDPSDNEYDKLFKGYAIISDMEIYSNNYKKRVEMWEQKYKRKINPEILMGFEGMVTDDGRFVHFSNGKMIVLNNRDEIIEK